MKKSTKTHKHREIALHSPNQQAMFFALSDELGFDKNEVKERAIKKFNLECFNDLKSSQINELIDKLQQRKELLDRKKQ